MKWSNLVYTDSIEWVRVFIWILKASGVKIRHEDAEPFSLEMPTEETVMANLFQSLAQSNDTKILLNVIADIFCAQMHASAMGVFD